MGLLALRAAPVLVAGAQAPPSAASPSVAAGSGAPEAPTGIAVDWAAVLTALDAGRRAALGSGSADDLARFVDPAGGAWAQDAALLARLDASGARLDGGSLELGTVRVQDAGPDEVGLVVRDRRLPYDVVEDGRSTRMPERPWQWWSVTLSVMPSLDGPSWRIADVRGIEGGER